MYIDNMPRTIQIKWKPSRKGTCHQGITVNKLPAGLLKTAKRNPLQDPFLDAMPSTQGHYSWISTPAKFI